MVAHDPLVQFLLVVRGQLLFEVSHGVVKHVGMLFRVAASFSVSASSS